MADQADKGNITTPNAADLNTAARKYAASRGWAMDDGSYPVRPADMHGRSDLQAAVKAVGRGGKSHDAIRKHIISRARAIGLSDLIPDNWSSSGSSDGNRGQAVTDVERRFTPGTVELRAGGEAKKWIGGYGSVFGKVSRNLGGFVEIVGSGAFNGSRAAGFPGVVARYNHDQNMLLGTTAGGTLQLRVDNAGLWYEVEPPAARADILELVSRGDIRHSSFAFRVMPNGDEWTTSDQGYPMRTLHDVQLFDVAPVVDPAYPDATAGARALSGALASLAAHVDAPMDEVRSLAETDELRKFFVRSDTPSTKTPAKRIFGPAAAAALLARRQDPWA